VNLLEAREKLAATLAPIDDGDPAVLVSLVEAIEPPALMLGWADPWMTAENGCFAQGNMLITAVASRLQPGEGVAILEQLVDYTLGRLDASATPWQWSDVGAPRVFVIAQTNYLACQINVKVTLD
jgi:hypothetical protein